jgi:hypothetical protein
MAWGAELEAFNLRIVQALPELFNLFSFASSLRCRGHQATFLTVSANLFLSLPRDADVAIDVSLL